MLLLVGLGLGIGASVTFASSTIMNAAPPERGGMAASIEEVGFELGNSLGVAIFGSVMTVAYAMALVLPDTAVALPATVRDSLDEALLIADSLPAETAVALRAAGRAAFSTALVGRADRHRTAVARHRLADPAQGCATYDNCGLKQLRGRTASIDSVRSSPLHMTSVGSLRSHTNLRERIHVNRNRIGLAAVAIAACFAGSAGAATVQNTNSGSVSLINSGTQGQVFPNIILSGQDRSNYLVFDLSAVAAQLAGTAAGSATLTISSPGFYSSADATENYSLWDFSGDMTALRGYGFTTPPSAAAATTLLADLRTASSYGSAVIDSRFRVRDAQPRHHAECEWPRRPEQHAGFGVEVLRHRWLLRFAGRHHAGAVPVRDRRPRNRLAGRPAGAGACRAVAAGQRPCRSGCDAPAQAGGCCLKA